MLPNAQPKPRPHLLSKYDRERERDRIDREQRAICKARSGGQCEVWTDYSAASTAIHRRGSRRCRQRASENHHLIGGMGIRNRGKSILAAHRIDTCLVCHREITNNVLVPVDGTKKQDAATVRYERIR